jgi:DNA-binding SARP family transcriptional activator/tetratricopeptide (TPR) repeat protein
MRAKTSGARLGLVLLGGFAARVAPSARPLSLSLKKARAILACLALAPGGTRPRQTLTGLLWPEAGEAEARNNFRVTLSSLRTALAAAQLRCLHIDGDTVLLDLDMVDVDTVTLRRLVENGSPDALTEAIRVYRGDLLAGLDLEEAPFEEWLVGEREQLRILALGACEKMLAHQLRADADEAALASAMRLLSLDPLRDSVHATVMRLHAKHGRFGQALRQYNACALALQRDLGVAPAAPTRRLYEEILRSGTAGHGGRPRRGADAREPTVSWPPMVRAPHVGRVDEMRKLHEVLKDALGRRGHLVAVMGEAGIGKTRLVNELAGEAERAEAQVWLGRAYESDRILTFGPWVDAIRTSGLARDGASLADFSPVWRSELGRLVPELGDSSLKEARHQDNPRRIFEAVAQLVKHAIARQPLVLILEDLHWADELSVRLLSFLARRIAEWSVLIVATAREEEVDARSALRRTLNELRTVGVLVPVDLGPLSQTHTAALVHELVQTEGKSFKPESVIPRIWALSRGNPFMIVEAVQALGDDATAAGRGSLPLTPVVREVVAGRLARLSEQGRRLISIAAVIGRVFEFPVLQRASELRKLEAAEGVDDLIRRRLLNVVQHGLEVTHDWVREVAYGELQPPRRQILHAAVARAVETQYAENLEPHYPALARHYFEGEVWDKAVVYLHAAGRASAARVGHREAVSRFEGALTALRHLPETRDTIERHVDICLDLRYSTSGLGDFERMIAHLRDAEPLARRLDDERRLGWVHAYMGYYLRMARPPAAALPFTESARAIAGKTGDRELAIEADYQKAMACSYAGEHGQAQELFRRAVATGDALGVEGRSHVSIVAEMAARAYIVRPLAECGLFAEAVRLGGEAIRIAEDLDSPINKTIAHLTLAEAYEVKGEFDRAIPLLERALAEAHAWDLHLMTTTVMAALGYVYTKSERVADGVAILDQISKVYESPSMPASRSRSVVTLGEICLAADRLDEATALATRAVTLTHEYGQRGWEAGALRLLAETASLRRPRDVTAEAHYWAALAIAEALGMRPLAARCRLGLGSLRKDRPREAQAHLDLATTSFREMGMQFWLEKATAPSVAAP